MRAHFVGVGAAACRTLDALKDRVGDWRCFASAAGVVMPDAPSPSDGVTRTTITRRELDDFEGGLTRHNLLDDASYFERLRARDGTIVGTALRPPSPPEGIVVVSDLTTRPGSVLTAPLLELLSTNEAPVYLVALSDRTLSSVSTTLCQTANATIGVDVEAWTAPDADGPADDPGFPTAIAPRIQAAFCHVPPQHHPQRVIDAADVHRVLGASGGLVSVGYAEHELSTSASTPLGVDFFDTGPDVDVAALSQAIQTVTRKALYGSQTVPTRTQQCPRGLYVIGGPPEWLLHKPINDSRSEVTAELGADLMLGGDVPLQAPNRLFAAVVRSGVHPERE